MKSIQSPLPRRPDEVMYNGENITEVKFPCLCTFIYEGEEYEGILTKGWEDGHDLYEIHYASPQEDLTRLYQSKSLIGLLQQNQVEFKEGEIVFYE